MAETTIALLLHQEQRWHLFTHVLVYLLHIARYPGTCSHQIEREHLQAVAYRLVHLERDANEPVLFALSLQEVGAMKALFVVLQRQYEQGPPTDEASALALAHLAACRVLIEEAEQQVKTKTESR